jgi:hypothetical protein
MWHKANWVGLDADGWARWNMAPNEVQGPPADVSDAEALNWMGHNGWELIIVERVWDLPPGVSNTACGLYASLYRFKRLVES